MIISALEANKMHFKTHCFNNNNNNNLFQTQSPYKKQENKENWCQKEYTSVDIIRETNKVHRLDSTHVGTFKNVTD